MTQRNHTPLDTVDARLLALLQQDARRSTRELAKLLHVSASSIQRRLRALEQRGVIDRTIAVVRPTAVGQTITVLVDVWLEREDVASVTQFKRQMMEAPEVTQCYHVTGEHTFTIIVSLKDMEAFAPFAARVFDSNPAVKKFRTSVVMARVKTHGPVPVLLD